MPGRLAYVVGGNIWIWQGSSGRQITKGGQDGAPALSPDGSRLAYIRYDYSFSDLVISPSGGGEPQFLTDNRPPGETGSKDFVDKAVWALEPAWTGDGAGLTYTSDLGTDAPVLWAMDADGGNAHQLRTSPPAPPLEHPRSAPDGSILATSFGSGKAEVWRLDRDSGVWTEVAAPPDGAYDPAPSLDGKWVVYAGRTGKATDLWLVPADRSAPAVQLTHLGRARAPIFSPDGGQLAFLAEKDERFQIFVAAVRTSNGVLTLDSPQQVTSIPQGVDATARLSWSR
jgi:TolB protein